MLQSCMSEEHWELLRPKATCIKTLLKLVRSWDMCVDRQTNRQTDTHAYYNTPLEDIYPLDWWQYQLICGPLDCSTPVHCWPHTGDDHGLRKWDSSASTVDGSSSSSARSVLDRRLSAQTRRCFHHLHCQALMNSDLPCKHVLLIEFSSVRYRYTRLSQVVGLLEEVDF